MKIKCAKAECPICKLTASIQLFLNRSEVRYTRTRHFSHIEKESMKPQFTYCIIEDTDALKTLLKSHGISLNAEVVNGSLGQVVKAKIHDLELKDSSPIKRRSSSSLV